MAAQVYPQMAQVERRRADNTVKAIIQKKKLHLAASLSVAEIRNLGLAFMGGNVGGVPVTWPRLPRGRGRLYNGSLVSPPGAGRKLARRSKRLRLMLRFRTSATPSRYYTQGLIVAMVAILVVLGAMLVFLWWADRAVEEPAEPPAEPAVEAPPPDEPVAESGEPFAAPEQPPEPQEPFAEPEEPRVQPDEPLAEPEEPGDETGWVRPAYPNEPAHYLEQRRHMVEDHLLGRDIDNERVLRAMGRIARHRFVPDELRQVAYADQPLPIGHRQTISQPYIVALMTQLAEPKPTDRALDVGTGSGYQAAVLAEVCAEVYGIEILEPLAELGANRLAELGYDHVTVRHGDGFRGWPEKAPFDIIIVAAAPPDVPEPLLEQLAPGGRLVIPVGRHFQHLMKVRKLPDGSIEEEIVLPVRFVPMTGEAQKR